MSAPADDVTRRVTGAALWTYGGMISDRALRFIVFLVGARISRPHDFGVVLLAVLAVQATQALLNGGIPTALLQESEVSKPLLDTAFTINLAMCLLAAAVLLAGAGPLAAATHMALAPMLCVLALTPPINALGAVHVALIQRDLGFRALAVRQAGASVVASVLALAVAYAGGGIWTLIVRNVALSAAGTVAAWLAASYRPRLRLDWIAARGAVASGMRLWGAHLATMINAKGLDMIAGLLLGAVALGAMRIAGQTVMLLIDLTVGPMTALGFALLARAKTDPALFERTLLTIARFAALLIFPAFAGLYAIADPLLPLMFGERWAPAASVLPYMCAIGPALYFQFLITAALFAAGRSDRILHLSLIEAVLTVMVSFVGGGFGLAGLAAAGTVRLYLMMPLGWHWLQRDIGIRASRLIAPALPPLVAALAMAAVVSLVETYLAPMLAPVPLIAALIAIGFAVYAALMTVTIAELWRTMTPRRQAADAADARQRALAIAPQGATAPQ